jgi:hypothetical protein
MPRQLHAIDPSSISSHSTKLQISSPRVFSSPGGEQLVETLNNFTSDVTLWFCGNVDFLVDYPRLHWHASVGDCNS